MHNTATSQNEVCSKPKRKTGIPRLMEITLMRKGPVILAAVLAALAAIASFVPYLAIYWVIQEIMAVYPDVSALDIAAMRHIGLIAILGVLTNVLLVFFSLFCSHLAAYGTIAKLKEDFVSHVSRLPLGFHIAMGSGRLRKIMESNIENLEGFIAHDFTNTVSALVSPIIMLVLIFGVDWRFGLAVFAGIIIAFIVQAATSPGKKAQALAEEYQIALSDMSSAAVEYVRGISVVKAFGQTAFSFRRLTESIQHYTASVVPYSLSQETMTAAFTTAINNIYLLLIPAGIFVGIRAGDYAAFVARFVFFLIFVPAIGAILMKIVYALVNANQSAIEIGAMDSILSLEQMNEPDTGEKPGQYDVVFEDVSFSYEDAEEKALDSVSFSAKQGQITGIVGASGGGKSTIAGLIPRFYDVDTGRITIGGVDIRDITLETLMDTVSFVFQDSFLFKQSIFENIRIGRPDASPDEVITAAKSAQCDGFIRALPQGYDTVYGKAGTYLSGGEIQRIAIARAILKNAPILVLDEATAFADSENEAVIHEALEHLMQGKTVIMIAHRLSTIKGADQILVMDRGSLCERGTHAELLEMNGRYMALWQRYTEAIGWKITKEVANNA